MKTSEKIDSLQKENKEIKILLKEIQKQLSDLKELIGNNSQVVHHHHNYTPEIVKSPFEPPFIVTCKGTGNPLVQEPSTTEPLEHNNTGNPSFTHTGNIGDTKFDGVEMFNYIVDSTLK